MTHVYSLGHLMGRPDCGPLADHGVEALRGRFRDHVHGGWYAKVGPDGPTTTDKTAYEHAFVVLAGGERRPRPGRPGGARAAATTRSTCCSSTSGTTSSAWSSSSGTSRSRRSTATAASTPTCTRSRRCSPPRTSLGDASLRERALRIVTRVVHDLGPRQRLADPGALRRRTWTPQLDYNVDEPAHPFRPYGATIGHWLEWARLALHLRAGARRRRPGLAARRRPVAVRRVRPRGLGRRRRGRVRLHRGLVGRARRTRADALGRGRGHRDRRRAVRRDRRRVVRRRGTPPGGTTSPTASSTTSTGRGGTSCRPRNTPEQRDLERQAGHLPRVPGHADPAAAAVADPGRRPARPALA